MRMPTPATRPAGPGTGADQRRAAPPRWPRTAHVFRPLEDLRDRGDPFAGTELDSGAGEFFPGNLTEEAVLDLAGVDGDPWPPEPRETGPADEQGAYGVVPEPETAPPDAAWEYREEDVVWCTPPLTLAGLVQYGAVHTDTQCPMFVFRALSERSGVCLGELVGSHEGMEDLADFIARNTRAIVCMARGINGPQPLRGPAARKAER